MYVYIAVQQLQHKNIILYHWKNKIFCTGNVQYRSEFPVRMFVGSVNVQEIQIYIAHFLYKEILFSTEI